MSLTRTVLLPITLVSALGISEVASAQTTDSEVLVEVEPPPQPNEASSEKQEAAPREGKVIALHVGGFLEVIGVGLGAGVGVHVARDTLIEVDGMASAALTPSPTALASTSLGVRQFVTGSLYLRGAARYRYFARISESQPSAPNLGAVDVVSDIGPDVSLGNRWDIGVVTLGADWLGVYVPVTQITARQETVDDSTGEVVSSRELSRGDLSSPLEIRLFYVQLGLTF